MQNDSLSSIIWKKSNCYHYNRYRKFCDDKNESNYITFTPEFLLTDHFNIPNKDPTKKRETEIINNGAFYYCGIICNRTSK